MEPLTRNFYIFDSDTGSDDCAALLLAGAYARSRCALLLSTYGNYSLSTTTANLCTSAALGGFSGSVLTGASEPLPVEGTDAEPTPHAVPCGLVFTEYSPDFPAGIPHRESPDFLAEVYEAICAHAPCDYIAIGPLTNLALLLRRYPDVRGKLGEVVIMGGGLRLANVNAYAEYNIYCDALAAEEVFASGLPIHMAGLDVCMPTALRETDLARLRTLRGPLGRCMEHLVQIENDLSDSFGNPHGIIYDAVALAYYLAPELFRVRRTGVRVVTRGEQYGRTVEAPERGNVVFLESAGMDGYTELLVGGIERLTAERG